LESVVDELSDQTNHTDMQIGQLTTQTPKLCRLLSDQQTISGALRDLSVELLLQLIDQTLHAVDRELLAIDSDPITDTSVVCSMLLVTQPAHDQGSDRRRHRR
jgi:hypothetical protein